MPTISDPLSYDDIITRYFNTNAWSLVLKDISGSYRWISFGENQDVTVEDIHDSIDAYKNEHQVFLMTAPDYVSDVHTFKWDYIIDSINKAEVVQSRFEDDDAYYQSLYLGSILTLSPSGKSYIPWANSNLDRCEFCSGTGYVPSPIHNNHEYEQRQLKRSELTQICFSQFGSWDKWPKPQKEAAKELDYAMELFKETIRCPYCHSIGSREAYEDRVFFEDLDKKAESLGMWIDGDSGDGDSIILTKHAEKPKDDDAEE